MQLFEFGGVICGIVVSIKRIKLNRIKLIYFSAVLSFLLGDTFMTIGNNVYMWMIAGFFASFLLPFLDAGLNEIIYEKVPKAMQGRVFAARNSMQFFIIPIYNSSVRMLTYEFSYLLVNYF